MNRIDPMADPPELEAAPPTPSSVTQHRSTVTTDFPHELVVRPETRSGGDLWFRVPEWLIDSGVFAALVDSDVRVLLALLRRRDRNTGLALIAVEQLAILAGVGKRTAYEALNRLLEHPAGLLAKHSARAFEPLPGILLAGRSTERCSVPSDVRPAAKNCGQPKKSAASRTCAKGAVNSNSLKEPYKRQKTAAAAAALTSSTGPSEPSQDRQDYTTAVSMLRREGLSVRDAKAYALKTGLGGASRAIANANDLETRGLLRKRRGYIAHAARDGYALRERLEQRLVRVFAKKMASIECNDLKALLLNHGVTDSSAILTRELVHPHEIEDLRPDELRQLLSRRLLRLPLVSPGSKSDPHGGSPVPQDHAESMPPSDHFPSPNAGPSVRSSKEGR